MILAPQRAASRMNCAPAMTMGSLLAKAMVLPARIRRTASGTVRNTVPRAPASGRAPGPSARAPEPFPNGFPYFVSLPEFPNVGVGPEKAAKNLARFRQVVQMAGERGIKVSFMNYDASVPMGPWKTRKWGVDERWVAAPQEYPNLKYLRDPHQIEEYTRKAVLSFLRQVPELWMFGFRVGESGQPEDFYKKTYLAALAELPDSLNVYVRTWIADPQKVRELADLTQHHFYIEPKYNGEQLGSPYQAVLGGRQYPPSGSYEDYTDYPKKYSILWQIRATGTHRVFTWGSPEFARRTVKTCKFGQGVGFSMEPMGTYSPAAAYLHNNPNTDHGFYKWMFERQWLWHLTWGRTAYDPDVPEKVWTSEFVRRFGSQAGPLVYKAVVESSKIVPIPITASVWTIRSSLPSSKRGIMPLARVSVCGRVTG